MATARSEHNLGFSDVGTGIASWPDHYFMKLKTPGRELW
jgi:hypothetical protein